MTLLALVLAESAAHAVEPRLRVVVWPWSPGVDQAIDRAIDDFSATHDVDLHLVRIQPAGSFEEELEQAKRRARERLDEARGKPGRAGSEGPVPIFPGNYPAELYKHLEGPEPPDLFWIEPALVDPLAERGRILPLDALLDRQPGVLEGLPAGALQRFRRQGRLYGCPLGPEGQRSLCAFALSSRANAELAFALLAHLRSRLPPGSALSDDRLYVGDFSEESLRQWELSPEARVVRAGNGRVLLLASGAEAVWHGDSAGDFTLGFRYLPEHGTGAVSLQRTARRRQTSEYQLRFDEGAVSLLRAAAGQVQPLASADQRWSASEWYDVTIEFLRGWIRVALDGVTILTVFDPEPLPPGALAFSSKSGPKVVYADIRFKAWSAADAASRRWLIERPGSGDLLPPKRPELQLPGQVIPLEVAVYKAAKQPYRINPGPLPPNYTHAWVLDLRDVDRFKLYFATLDDIKLHKNDSIVLYNAQALQQGMPLASIKMTSTESELVIDISKAPFDQVRNSKNYKRIYLQLETSEQYVTRRFVLSGLEVLAPGTGSPEVLVLADDLNYAKNHFGPITETADSSGKVVKIYAPWNKLPLYGPPWDEATTAEGWYQVGQYLADNGQGFYALAYYNEHDALLRLYLRNYDLTDASVYSVTLSLLGRKYMPSSAAGAKMIDSYEELEGAFFPVHPNPNQWSSVTLPIKQWSKNSWIMIEVPLLYPMAKTLPAAKQTALPGVPQHYYRSIYEDALQDGRRNVLLEIKVAGFLQGAIAGDWVGKAVGDAVQKAGSSGPSASEIAKGIWEGIKTGKDWYDGAQELHGKAAKFYESHKTGPGASDPSMKILGGLVSLGAGAWAGPAGLAGAAFSLLSSFLFGGSSEPLHLSIDLSLHGGLKASVTIPHQARTCWFYLPGKFSISEAFTEGLPLDDARTAESFLPRYDRLMGLFGYRYNPADVKFPVVRFENQGMISAYGWDTRPEFVYPAGPSPNPAWLPDWGKFATETLEPALPVIYNPFAEITPMVPIVVSTTGEVDPLRKQFPYSSTPYSWWARYKWLFDVSWKTHVVPEPDDQSFPGNVTLHSSVGPQMYVRVFGTTVRVPAGLYVYAEKMPEGMLLQVYPHTSHVPSTYQSFKDVSNVQVHTWYQASWNAYEAPKADDPLPIHDVMYYWDIPYFWYARSRKDTSGNVPRASAIAHLRSPVRLDVTRYVIEQFWPLKVSPAQKHTAKSALLVDPASKN